MDKDYLNRLLHDLATSARYFKDTDTFIRKRGRCPSRELYEKGLKILDDAMIALYERMNDES